MKYYIIVFLLFLMFNITHKDENGQSIKVTKYTLNNEQIYVEIINYGATVISCWVPNVLGNLEDILLGFDQIEGNKS